MLSEQEYQTLRTLMKKAKLRLGALPKPRRISITRKDVRRLSVLLLQHQRVLVTWRDKTLHFLSWDGYQSKLLSAKRARAALTSDVMPGKRVYHPCCQSKGPRHLKSCAAHPTPVVV